MHAVILGTDTVLAAEPAEPIQLARACMRAGFDFVAPVSWGEELLAERGASVMASRRPKAAVVANCPFVAEALRLTTSRTRCIASVSPPVATARYLRAAFPTRELHVTFIGACPGATSPDVDERLLPDVFLAGLTEAGIDVRLQPRHLDGQLPADRSRHASVAGGAPETGWLAEHAGVSCLDATPATVDAVHAVHRAPVLIDLATACGCACARNREAADRLDPPRSGRAVVLPLPVSLADHRLLPRHRLLEFNGDLTSLDLNAADRMRALRATFLERGLSHVDALRPPEPLTSQRVAASLEPWSAVVIGTPDLPVERTISSDRHRLSDADGDATARDPVAPVVEPERRGR